MLVMMPSKPVMKRPLVWLISSRIEPTLRRSTPPLVFLEYEPEIRPKYIDSFSPNSCSSPIGL